MNKQSIIFIIIGILIIVGIGYIALKPKQDTVTQPNTSTENSNATSPEATQTPSVPAPIAVTIDYKSDGTFEAQPIHATENQEVIITVSADITDEVHLHGYDVSEKVSPGKPAILILTTTKQTGRFDLELESKKIIIGALEVHPR